MRHLVFTLLFLSIFLIPLEATKRALVIGIGDYPSINGWTKTNGDKDITLVRDMLIKNDFQQQDIIELKNEEATALSIRKALSTLVSKAGHGDVIYIHFSGHGQRVTDINGDEKDRFDEAWIAYDAQYEYVKNKYEGENHIIDDQLFNYLSQLRKKIGENGKLIVVSDACHSGGGSRGEDDEEKLVARGASSAFVIPGNHKPYTQTSTSVDWVFISACKSYETNYEYKGNGSLTYALFQMQEKLSSTSWEDIKGHISEFVSRNAEPRMQTPVYEYPNRLVEQPLL